MSLADAFWLSLLFKAALTATIIVSASLIVERGGPFLGAMIASLPTSVGAAYIVMATEHTPAFIGQSAIGSLAANAAGVSFAAVYALLARRQSLFTSLGVALLVWFGFTSLLRLADFTLTSALILNIAVAAVTIPLTAGTRYAAVERNVIARKPYDIPVRAAAVSLFVVIVTTLSHTIGATASGVFAVFPMAMSSFIVILHSRIGGPATANVIAHAQIPLLGLIPAFTAVHLLSPTAGVWWALLIGLFASLAWNLFLWFRRRRDAARLPLE